MQAFNFKKIIFISSGIFFLIISAWISSCNVLGPDEYSDDILITDETGRVIGGDYTDWCTNGISNGDYLVHTITTGDFLPAGVDSLKISKDSNRVNVSWITTSESQCKKFNLERQMNGLSRWDTIKKTVCLGSSSGITRYYLIDTLHNFGRYLYRLRQIDSSSLSTVFQITDTVKYGTSITPITTIADSYGFGPAYPNPAINRMVKIRFTVPQSGFVRVYFDNDDNIVSKNLQAGAYEVEVNGATYGFVNEVRRIFIQVGNYSCYGDIQFRE
ncbi:MAG: hypothetical protein JSS63_10875 [Bacteroidetes bacterium]|nr:hypothetical protein [Bacteroidota bacterium]